MQFLSILIVYSKISANQNAYCKIEQCKFTKCNFLSILIGSSKISTNQNALCKIYDFFTGSGHGLT